MTWFDNILDLQFYHQPKGVPCYCEAIAYPTDMFLQGHSFNGNGSYTLKLYVYSADGLTQYEDATTYFDHYFGVMPGGDHFFNARLRSFSPAMCELECYILRAEVVQGGGVVVFNKYTERYCQNNCCDVAKGISFEQDGYAMTATDLVSLNGVSPNVYIPSGSCGEPLIRIISQFDCIDEFSGDFFGTPDTVLSGTVDFTYKKITAIRGRIVRRPRNIKREMSYNCKLQRSESAAQYLLEGFEYLPSWKMYEIEGQLHANKIYIDDFSAVREYQYVGGAPFKQVSNCFELFKLETTLEDCTQRQVFGCGNCTEQKNFDGSNKVFAIPADYSDGGFYNSQKERIADDYEGLMNYFSTRNGASGVSDVNTVSMDCSVYGVLAVSSTGQVDTFIYYDSPIAANKITGLVVDDINDLCNYLPAICIKPAVSTFAVTVPVCATPAYDVFTIEDTNTDDVSVSGYHDWVEDEVNTYASVYNNEVTLNMVVVNEEITEDPADPRAPVLVDDIIGVIGTNGRPATMVVLNSANSSLGDDITVTIDSSGVVKYYGPSTTASSTRISIQLTNLKYNI